VRIATISALVSITLGSAFFAACSSSSSGGGNTGGTPTVGGGGSGGVIAGGAGGGTGATTGGGGAGGTSGAGGSTAGASCKGKCGSDQPQGSPECYCDDKCTGNKDCCSDYDKECAVPNLKLPTGCVTNANFKTPCNPVTNEGCTAAGSSCDYGTGGVKCYPDGNTEAAGAPCDIKNNKFCVPKYHCDGASEAQPIGVCKAFCCSDSDCTGGLKCVAANASVGSLGTCGGTITPTDGGTDGSTDGGGGTGGGTSDAATDAPPG
jgi:Somatomedin B domain